MMQYYRMWESSDTKVIGRKFPQTQVNSVPTSVDDPLFLGNYMMGKAPDNALVPTGILEKSAKRTDLLSTISNYGFWLNPYVSDKLGQLLLKSNSAYMQFFKTKLLEHNGYEYPYWIVHAHQFCFEMLDLEQSFIGHYTQLNFKELIRRNTTTDVEDLRRQIAVYHTRTEDDPAVGNIGITKIVFRQDMDIDFLRCGPFMAVRAFMYPKGLKTK